MRRSTRLVRQSSEALTLQSSNNFDRDDNSPEPVPRTKPKKKRAASPPESDAYDSNANEEPNPVTKKRKTVRPSKRNNGDLQKIQRLLSKDAVPSINSGSCTLPTRHHALAYHRPLLLDRSESRTALLQWFDSVATTRGMPWRKPWINPSAHPDAAELRSLLERRAYEVWISEIMLQQTRVAVVIDYWNRWVARWPTIQALAAAAPDDVLAAWRGLGYYSRATRIHKAAKLVCGDSDTRGLLPAGTVELEKKVPGVGRYTAGAISAIVFGRAAAMVDGNVLRVLSRQCGVFGDVKGDKGVIDLLWAVADALVNAIARDEGDGEVPKASDRPGRWGQALMELGSTICTPKPNCAACPVNLTCRAYDEGLQFAGRKRLAPESRIPASSNGAADIEDTCTICKPFEDYADPNEEDDEFATTVSAQKSSQSKKQASLQSFFFTAQPNKTAKKATARTTASSTTEPSTAALAVITSHARKFPLKTIKKAVREEETLVCAVRRSSDGRYLVHRRPEKGLLAGLWEFPSHILPGSNDSATKTRKGEAVRFVASIQGMKAEKGVKGNSKLRHIGELGSVIWLFSHLKLTMYVQLFELDDEGGGDDGIYDQANKTKLTRRWSNDIDNESMGTGMRKCWALVKDSVG
ncbi:DNA glycosylase [Xylariales sp. AK1849]|nr:DNA glycosylase [Xylariales sp. AK1849]